MLQLRYYDSAEDPSCKGFIDMKEVTSVVELSNVQGLPKRADDHAVFEVIQNFVVEQSVYMKIYMYSACNTVFYALWIEYVYKYKYERANWTGCCR